MSTIHQQTKTQVTLDQCTGAYALRLRATAITMDQSYARINQFRALALSQCTQLISCPLVLKFADAYLKAEKTIQTSAKKYWDAQMVLWNTTADKTHCNLEMEIQKTIFPKFPYPIIQGNKSDLLLPLNQKPSSSQFTVGLFYKNITSEAKVSIKGATHEWTVAWTR